jgi:octaprenyl-diphosphate synthase
LFQRSDDLLDFDVRNHEGKAVLGDLKSGYMNSFTVFVFEGLSETQKSRAREAQSLGEFKRAVGEAHFDQRLVSFDAMNVKQIELYAHNLERLRTHLASNEQALTQDLGKLSELLYWRKA